MQLRKLGVLPVLVIAFCLLAPPARAQQDCGDHCIQNPADGFPGWDALEPTGYNPPTTQSCTAYEWNHQACHVCTVPTDQNNNATGPPTCGWTKTSAGCACKNSGTTQCGTDGACTYYP